MGIEEIKDLVYDLYCEFENEISDFEYKGRELTQEEVELSLYLLEQFTNKLDAVLDNKVYETKRRILDLEHYIDNCSYGKRELYELQNLNTRLEILESEVEDYE